MADCCLITLAPLLIDLLQIIAVANSAVCITRSSPSKKP